MSDHRTLYNNGMEPSMAELSLRLDRHLELKRKLRCTFIEMFALSAAVGIAHTRSEAHMEAIVPVSRHTAMTSLKPDVDENLEALLVLPRRTVTQVMLPSSSPSKKAIQRSRELEKPNETKARQAVLVRPSRLPPLRGSSNTSQKPQRSDMRTIVQEPATARNQSMSALHVSPDPTPPSPGTPIAAKDEGNLFDKETLRQSASARAETKTGTNILLTNEDLAILAEEDVQTCSYQESEVSMAVVASNVRTELESIAVPPEDKPPTSSADDLSSPAHESKADTSVEVPELEVMIIASDDPPVVVSENNTSDAIDAVTTPLEVDMCNGAYDCCGEKPDHWAKDVIEIQTDLLTDNRSDDASVLAIGEHLSPLASTCFEIMEWPMILFGEASSADTVPLVTVKDHNIAISASGRNEIEIAGTILADDKDSVRDKPGAVALEDERLSISAMGKMHIIVESVVNGSNGPQEEAIPDLSSQSSEVAQEVVFKDQHCLIPVALINHSEFLVDEKSSTELCVSGALDAPLEIFEEGCGIPDDEQKIVFGSDADIDLHGVHHIGIGGHTVVDSNLGEGELESDENAISADAYADSTVMDKVLVSFSESCVAHAAHDLATVKHPQDNTFGEPKQTTLTAEAVPVVDDSRGNANEQRVDVDSENTSVNQLNRDVPKLPGVIEKVAMASSDSDWKKKFKDSLKKMPVFEPANYGKRYASTFEPVSAFGAYGAQSENQVGYENGSSIGIPVLSKQQPQLAAVQQNVVNELTKALKGRSSNVLDL